MSVCIWRCFVSHKALTNGWRCCLYISLASCVPVNVCLCLKPVRELWMCSHYNQRIPVDLGDCKEGFYKIAPHVPLATWQFPHLETRVSFPSPSLCASITNTRALPLFTDSYYFPGMSNRQETELQPVVSREQSPSVCCAMPNHLHGQRFNHQGSSISIR